MLDSLTLFLVLMGVGSIAVYLIIFCGLFGKTKVAKGNEGSK